MLAMPSNNISVMVSKSGHVMAARLPCGLPAGCRVCATVIAATARCCMCPYGAHLHTTTHYRNLDEHPTRCSNTKTVKSLLAAGQQKRPWRIASPAGAAGPANEADGVGDIVTGHRAEDQQR